MYIALLCVSVLLMIVAGFAKAICDTIQFKFEFSLLKTFGKWWNPRESWKLKYTDALTSTKKAWWYLGLYKPSYDERFAYSTTVFVGFTDAWHFWQLIHHLTLLSAGICFGVTLSYLLFLSLLYLLLVLPLYIVFALTFHIWFHNILSNKK